MKVYGNVEDVMSPKFCGSIKYCPPEAVSNNPFRAMPGEIWTIGIVLFTLFHGGNPFFDINEILEAELRIDPQ